MRLRRVLSMGIPEIAGRSRQESRKWLERARVAVRDGRPEDVLKDLNAGTVLRQAEVGSWEANRRGAARALLERFKESGPARFFEGAVSATTPALISERTPEARERTLEEAGAIVRMRFDLLGHLGLFFGDPVDWHLDPVSGRRAPLVHWSRLEPLDHGVVGDSKVVWELNRHQWLVRLGQAFRFTGDERLGEVWARQVRDWMKANPPGLGINWASSLEVALRLIAWCWSLFLFRESRALSPDLFLDMLAGIRDHASHVERYLSRYFSPNTHLTGEALGLFYAGAVFPELRGAARWRALGSGILREESARQVLPDGVYFEQSTCYQMYTIEILLHFLLLARRCGLPAPEAVERRVQGMLDFILAVRRPDGSIPQIGDGDGGRLLSLARRGPEDARGLFSTAAALFGRPDYAWAAGGVAPETLWLLGPGGLGPIEAQRPQPPAGTSRLFASGGYAVMRDGFSSRAHHLIFDVGPLGCPISGGHGHADLLGIQLSAFGTTFLPDPGTYCYTAAPSWRDYFRGSAAHSTVIVDGAGQAVPDGPFAWRDRPRARLHHWESTEAFDFADAEHDAYKRLPDPVLHRRRVLFVKPRYFVVVDDLEGAAEHRVELRFQFAPMAVSLDPDHWARAQANGRHVLHVRPFACVPLPGEVREKKESPIEGWISPDYGRRRGAPVLIYRTATRLPLRIVTLLLPMEHPLSPRPAVAPLFGEGSGPVGILFEESGESVRFDGGGFAVERR